MARQPTTECPTCRRPVRIPPDDEPMGSYPFCTERCKLIDLGRWFDGSYQIAVVEPDQDAGDGQTPKPRPAAVGDGESELGDVGVDRADDGDDEGDGDDGRSRRGPRPNRG